MGAVVPEALAAADRLGGLGLPADVVVVTSPGLLFRALQARRGLDDGADLDPRRRSSRPTGRAPMVTVLDGHPHTLAFLAGVNGVGGHAPGRDARSGRAATWTASTGYHGLDADTIVGAALDLVD